MKKVIEKEIDSHTPGLLIDDNGDFYTMDNKDIHQYFFKEFIKKKLDISMNTDNLVELMHILIRDCNTIPYIGCTSGDRKYNEGSLYLEDLDKLTTEQINSIIKLYGAIGNDYLLRFYKLDYEKQDEEEISLGDIYEEYVRRMDDSKTIK